MNAGFVMTLRLQNVVVQGKYVPVFVTVILFFYCLTFNFLFIFQGFLTRSIVAAIPSQQNSNTLMVYG